MSLHSFKTPLSILIKSCTRKSNSLLHVNPLTAISQIRNTHIVEHFTPQKLITKHPDPMEDPQKAHTESDERYIYKTLQYTYKAPRQDPIDVLLLTTVAGLGNKGQIVKVQAAKARRMILLPQLGVYASPENLERYRNITDASDEDLPSSFNVSSTIHHLGGLLLWVSMSLEHEWELQKWHLRTAFRKAGVECPESAIELPAKPIRGPDLSLQQKAFYVTVTINQKEKVRVRCLINHVTSDVRKKLPYAEVNPEEPLTPIFPEDEAYLNALHEWRVPLRASEYGPQVTPEQFQGQQSSAP